MPIFRRGQVVRADFGEPEGHEPSGERPAVVVSNDDLTREGSLITVVPTTTQNLDHVFMTEVLLDANEGGIPRASKVLGRQIRAIAPTRILQVYGQLPPEVVREINGMLAFCLGLEEFPSGDVF